MSITLTRNNVTYRGYTKCDEHEIGLSQAGADALVQIIERTKNTKRSPNALNFGIFEDGEMSKATFHSSTAVVLNWRLRGDFDAATQSIMAAARELQVGHFLMTVAERDGSPCIAVVIPLVTPINSDRYARLVGVFYDQMRALGVPLTLADGCSSMTHQFHLHQHSEALWVPGPACNGIAKIRATAKASQRLDHRRMTENLAAETQLAQPTLTACDDLFDWGSGRA